MLDEFDIDGIIREHARFEPESGTYPAACEAVLSAADMDDAWAEITTWPGYAPTPLRGLSNLSRELRVDEILYKDEGRRFGLGSFKALGGAYAVLRVVAEEIAAKTGSQPSLADIRNGTCAADAAGVTVTTATDGNHGRSVAWGAQMAGAACRIYIHAEVSEGRKAAMEAFGAEVIRVDGDYDESLRQCVGDAAANGWKIVSDTSFEGYMDVPRHVMAGYGVFAREIYKVIRERPPTHVFIQAGVGGVAASLLASFWQLLGERRPRFIIVEPARAACVLESAKRNAPSNVSIEEETIMAGLSCGEISLIAWEVLSRGASDVLSIGEHGVEESMRLLASGKAGGGKLVAGESAVAGLVALIAAAKQGDWRMKLGIDNRSRILLIGCEGATDPEIYEKIVGAPAPG
ncbi:MAG: diaminopropionate ammonia-lyase [Rhodospirillales bacterium]